jgi:hypothetical protein
MRPAQVTQILGREFTSAAAGQHTPVMLWGPPGIGKSDLVREVAERHAVPVVDLRLSQLEPTDLRGIPFRTDGLVEWAVPALLPDAERHGAAGILFLDEINAAPPTVSQGDRGVVYSMPSPLANRFTHLEVEPNLDDWVDWAHGRGVDPRLIGFLRFRPDLLFDFDPAQTPTAFPSPRTWEFSDRALAKFGDDRALLSAALQGCVGPAAGIEAAAYIEHLDRLPDIDAIANGTSDEVPEGIDLQYAVAAALVRRALQAREAGDPLPVYGHLLAYAGKLPQRELGVMLVADLYRAVGQPLCEAPQFATWAGQVADVMLVE